MGIDELLQGLNAAQCEAVKATEGPVLILAGAGSGKTRVITHRLAYLVERGASPGSILAVTFTNKAADEMLHRVRKLTGRYDLRMWISTFHSAAVRILRRDIEHLGRDRDFSIYDEDDSTALVKQIIRDFGRDPKEEKPARYVEIISRAKDEMLSPDEWLDRSNRPRDFSEKAHGVFVEYQKRLRAANALDFGDLLVECVRLLSLPEMAERYRGKFSYIMVDEYQDTNRAQYEMIRILASGHRNICVVGDDDQSIYEWRGADRRNILEFEKDYPDARVVTLYQNYRSTQSILDAASALISHNVRLREKRLFTERGGGIAPEVWNAGNEYDELERIVRQIRRNLREGSRLKDHAVFYRVHAQSRVVEEIFSASGIDYQMLNGVSFYQRAEIKDVIAYLRVLANLKDEISLKRIVNNPPRGLGEVTIARVRMGPASPLRPDGESVPDSGAGALSYLVPPDPPDSPDPVSLFEALERVEEIADVKPAARKKIRDFCVLMRDLSARSRTTPIAELIRELLKTVGYLNQYDVNDPEQMARVENVREFLSAAEEFQASSHDSSLGAFLERISLATDVDKYDPDRDAVILTTLHSAKGLEFPHVFITGCEEMLFPHARAYDERRPAAMEEERRLAYVGMTRAMNSLVLTRAVERRIYGRLTANPASRFLVEAGLVTRSMSAPRPVGVPIATAFIEAPRRNETPVVSTASDRAILTEGDVVIHRKFGRGKVVYVADSGDENEIVRVRFQSGTKDLLRRYAQLTKGA